MGAVETLVRQVVEHPQRRWIVISLTLLTGFLTLWPAADEYLAAGATQEELRATLGEAEQALAQLATLRKTAADRANLLAELEKRTVPTAGMQKFRDELVDLARRAGCRLEGIEMAGPLTRTWREGDHPLKAVAPSEKNAETPFEFTSQQLTLKLSGPLDKLREFLTKLQEIEKFSHTSGLTLRPDEPERKEAVLELSLTLFNLERKKPGAV